MSQIFNQTFEFQVSLEDQSIRLDKFLVYKLSEISRTKIKKLIEERNLLLNDKEITDAGHILKASDRIKIFIPRSNDHHLEAKNIAINIVYEDEVLIVVDKPPFLTVHPGAGNHNDTLVNALVYHFGGNLSKVGGEYRPGIVHRLDKDTSGLILIAKDDITHAKLAHQLAERSIKRTYHALVYGSPTPAIGRIETNIVRSSRDRMRMEVARVLGRKAITDYHVLETFGDKAISLVQCRLHTGRTHQIRVHLTHKKNPLIGDQTYGNHLNHNLSYFPAQLVSEIKQFKRQALHAVQLQFTHPLEDRVMQFESGLAPDISELLLKIKSC